MGPDEFALCMWLLMLASFLSGFGQNAMDDIRGRPTSFFKYTRYWVVNAISCSRGLWALLQVAFFSKWFSVERASFPGGINWNNGYFWICIACILITLNQLARLKFPKESNVHVNAEGVEEELSKNPERLKSLTLLSRFGFYGGLAMFILAGIVYFWH